LCLQKQILISGLWLTGSCPCSLQKSSGDQMDVSGLDGLNDTPLLAGCLRWITSSTLNRGAREKQSYQNGYFRKTEVIFPLREKPAHPL
jgi:hypothetical protein